jgi:hypothetical protein
MVTQEFQIVVHKGFGFVDNNSLFYGVFLFDEHCDDQQQQDYAEEDSKGSKNDVHLSGGFIRRLSWKLLLFWEF